MVLKSICRAMAAAFLGGLLAAPALAQMPAPVKTEHPRLLASQLDIQQLRDSIMQGEFPSDGGSITVSFVPQLIKPADDIYAVLFGAYEPPGGDRMFIRHAEGATASSTRFHVGMARANSSREFAIVSFDAVPDKEGNVTVVLSWNRAEGKASIAQNGKVIFSTSDSAEVKAWEPKRNNFLFGPRIGEQIKLVEVRDVQGHVLHRQNGIDYDLHGSLTPLYTMANKMPGWLAACSPTDLEGAGICNVATAGRNVLIDTAKNLSLAYKLSDNPNHLTAAKAYADRVLKAPVSKGGEWSMSSRVGALGVLYDWLYRDLGPQTVAGDAARRSYNEVFVDTIKATVASTVPEKDNLVDSTCGHGNTFSASRFDCEVEPVYENWNPAAGKPSISSLYLTGHNMSAVSGMSMGLLAIADTHTEVLPMLNTAYKHFQYGFVRARELVSVDGGHHVGYGYNASSEVAERLLLWRKALAVDANTEVLKADWLPKLIYPFIYGQRHDSTFPARGDVFPFNAGFGNLAALALSSAALGNDPIALGYYQNQIKPVRQRSERIPLLWERMLYPTTVAPAGVDSLELARHFRTAGFVTMRDSWDFAQAAMLDFKSTSFISENHHHMDQNSFSLNYKAPLLLDAGQYDEYNTPHWWNYYTRTIAHNSIVVFDKTEVFKSDTNQLLTNDGGQWLSGRSHYPTLEQLKEGQSHWLQGVTAFEHGDNYSYTAGNASRAYSANKMEQDNGFLRHVLFLRDPARRYDASKAKPIILVFDSVRTKNGLAATSLLQAANKPASNASEAYEGNGRTALTFANSADRRTTIRNGGGMVTVETLLPEQARVVRVGLNANETGQCRQAPVSGEAAPVFSNDCRYLVQYPVGNDQFAWYNYPNDPSKVNVQKADAGGWRLEISPAGTPAAGQTQYFLNVLNVADNDGQGGPAASAVAQRLNRANEASEAVLIQNRLMVVFNRGATPAGTYSWTSANGYSEILATGLKKNAAFVCTRQGKDGGYVYKIEEGTGSAARSSSGEGVLSCTAQG
ncbi:heparinase II/III-family protein [Massilia sp. MB5]|uniref:heparinase II/III domain-containing protein n=1 Tax=Massilia sp. MB5 TaxID=2919578 RepID=UPI001F0DD754|nr:heparinase II/III family protein [Massilia sp. MB5]UMR33202.1 heparinase II/III-family protein [Massilia sp. MB5]